MSPDDPRHGSNAGYRKHNLDGEKACPACRFAANRYEKRLALDHLHGHPRRISSVGTARRLQALACLGYSYPCLGELLNVTPSQIYKWAGRRCSVRISTFERIDDLYAELCMRPARSGRRATFARSVAARNGWLPPLAWDDIDNDAEPPAQVPEDRQEGIDHAVVQRVIDSGTKPRLLTRAEAAEVTRRLLGLGLTPHQIETGYGMKPERYTREVAA